MYYYILQNGTVYFLFISGFLFHYLYNPAETIFGFWTKKLQRLVLPYLVASIPGFAILIWEQGLFPDFWYILRSLFTGTGHYNDTHWFIPTIILVFATYPLLRLLMTRRKLLSVLAGVGLMVSLVTFRSIANANPLLNLLHFYGIFLFGMTASAWWEPWAKFLEARFWEVVILGLVIFSGLMLLVPFSLRLEMETVVAQGGWTLDWSTLARLVMILPLLSILMKLSVRGKRLKFLSISGKMSFGIFFYHTYLIYFLNSTYANQFLPQNSLLNLGLNAFFVLGILWSVLTLSKKIFGKNSIYLLGY